VTIINAEIDPLKSDGDMLAEKLKAAGVTVEHKVFNGVVHEFFGMAPLVAKATESGVCGSSTQEGFWRDVTGRSPTDRPQCVGKNAGGFP